MIKATLSQASHQQALMGNLLQAQNQAIQILMTKFHFELIGLVKIQPRKANVNKRLEVNPQVFLAPLWLLHSLALLLFRNIQAL